LLEIPQAPAEAEEVDRRRAIAQDVIDPRGSCFLSFSRRPGGHPRAFAGGAQVDSGIRM